MRPTIRTAPSAAPQLARRPPVWLPWVAAPAFLLLPIGGCGAAATLKRTQVASARHESCRRTAAPPLVPVATIVPALPGPR